MERWSRLIAALAVKNVLHLFAIVWVSVVVLLWRFVRPEVIAAVGPRGWALTVLPLFILLFTVWISFVVLVRRDARLFAATDARRSRPEAEREPRPG
jgi:hypothetical protein